MLQIYVGSARDLSAKNNQNTKTARLILRKKVDFARHQHPGGGGGVLPYMGYIGMCGPKGYGFSAVLVINRVSIIAILPPLWS